MHKKTQDTKSKQELLWNTQHQASYASALETTSFHNSEAQDIVTTLPADISLFQAHQIIQTLTALGREYKYRLQSLQEKREELQKQYDQLTQQIQQSQKNREEFQKISDEQSEFFCDKIDGNCPYVDLINTGIAKKNKQQGEHLLQQHEMLVTQQKSLENQKEDKEKETQIIQLEQDIQNL